MDLITYRPAHSKDIPFLVDFFNVQYTRKKDAQYYQWQYFDSYYPTLCMTAWHNTELIGSFTVQKRVLSDGSIVGHLIDLLVEPQWRGKGIFFELGKRAIGSLTDLQAITVFPNANGRIACEKSLGMKTIVKIDDIVLSPPIIIKQVEGNQSDLIRFDNGSDYIKWRFDQNPEHTYQRIAVQTGYAITKLFKDPKTGDQFGDIVEYALKNYEEIVPLFTEAAGKLFKKDIEHVATWALPHTHLFQVLMSAGAHTLPRERYFCIKILDPQHQYLNDIARWEVVQADAEIY
jgi:GNAT superfamily N-acetyltransferase